MPVATRRLIIVCPPDQRDNVNATLNAIAGATGDGNVMSAHLTSPTDPSGPAVAYWTSWAMDDATQGQIMSAINSGPWRPKLSNAELTVHEPPTAPTWGSQRVYLFNGFTWDPDAVVAALGLSRPMPPD